MRNKCLGLAILITHCPVASVCLSVCLHVPPKKHCILKLMDNCAIGSPLPRLFKFFYYVAQDDHLS